MVYFLGSLTLTGVDIKCDPNIYMDFVVKALIHLNKIWIPIVVLFAWFDIKSSKGLTFMYIVWNESRSSQFLILRNWPRPFFIGTIDDSLIHSWRIDTELFSREITFLNKQGIEEDWVDVDKRDKIYIKIETEKLKENEKGNIERLEKHSKLIMPILTPAYPQQSSAFNVNYSTMKIIKQTIIEG